MKDDVLFEADPRRCWRRGRLAVPDRVRPDWEESSAGCREPSSELSFKRQILAATRNKPWKKDKVAQGE